MSHFTLGVFTRKKVEKDAELAAVMAPFWEGDGEEGLLSRSGYFLFSDQTEQYRHSYETESVSVLTDEEGNLHFVYGAVQDPPEGERVTRYRLKDFYPTFEDYMREEGFQSDQNGRYGFWYNPNAKYDYFSIGGRWNGALLTKDGKRVNSAKVTEIDFERMKRNALAELPPFEEYLAESYLPESYLRGKYPTENDYRTVLSTFYTFAILTPEGLWLEEGQVGSFGFSSETREEAMHWINGYRNWLEKYRDCFLTVLDCHI